MSDLSMFLFKQRFPSPHIEDIEAEVRRQFHAAGIHVPSGGRVAITAGSRGIANLAGIIRATVAVLLEKGAQPFVIPAMGSHGGATAEGQEEVLASYGVTEAAVGAPLLSSMEVVEIPAPGLKHRLFMDKLAWESDGVLLLNRAKPHTDFHGRWESGLAKMAVIGLGKKRLAEEIHSYGIHGLRDLIPPAAEAVIATGKVIGGVGIAENAYDQTMEIAVADSGKIMETDSRLLELARDNMPSLPVDSIDVLIIDEMGKDKSGTGVDTNIIGRISIRGEEDPEFPDIGTIVISDLSEPSHGNAIGVGLGDVITKRLHDKIDFDATNANSITSSFLERCKIPLVADNDKAAVEIALRAAGCRDPNSARVVRIRSTLELSEVLVSEPIKREIEAMDSVELKSGPVPLFGKNGTMCEYGGDSSVS